MAETLQCQLFDDRAVREAQQRRLLQLQAELKAEGANGQAYLAALRARAASWPE